MIAGVLIAASIYMLYPRQPSSSEAGPCCYDTVKGADKARWDCKAGCPGMEVDESKQAVDDRATPWTGRSKCEHAHRPVEDRNDRSEGGSDRITVELRASDDRAPRSWEKQAFRIQRVDETRRSKRRFATR